MTQSRRSQQADETAAESVVVVPVPIGKVSVAVPKKPVVRDLTNPKVIESIWADADRAVRADRARRRRRIRTQRLRRTLPWAHA